MKKILSIVLILTNFAVAFAVYASRPKIGLVLSGGGARGAAHIGVIEALEEMHVPIDFIVGTSMGAVIGGLYAAGIPIETIREDFSKLNWEDDFSYNIRTDLTFRRKLDSDIFILKNFISYTPDGFHIPTGFISGQRLYQTFNSYILAQQPIGNFSQLSIPFKAVSTHLLTGKPVVLEKGDLALSLLASMAVPGIISPVDMHEWILVDGGVSDNLPVEVAKKMGADVVIVVNVGTPLSTREEIVDFTSVLGQITNILTNLNEKASEALLTDQDILITPNLKNIRTQDFNKFADAVTPGKMAAYHQRQRLTALSCASFHGVGPVQLNRPIEIDEVRIKNESIALPSTFFHYVSFDRQLVKPAEVDEKITRLYGFGIFERIYYGIEDTPDGKALLIQPKDRGNDHLYFEGSLFLDTNFRETNDFSLLLGITNEEFNSLLGEWRLLFNIGHGEGVFAEIYQPLTRDLTWFVNPSISITRTPQTIYYDYDPLAVYSNTDASLNFSLGKNFGNWGRIRGFWEYDNNTLKRRIGPEFIPVGHIQDADVGISLEWDTLDNLYFPQEGFKGQITYSAFSDDFGGDSDFQQLSITNIGAISCGKHAFVLAGKYNRTLKDIASFTQQFYLGGLFELTGLNLQQLFGNNAGLVSAIYFYNWKKINIIPDRPMPIYVGASLEEGKVWDRSNLSQNSHVGSASVFMGADTIIGPIYFAVGATDTGHKAVHLTLRPVFK